MGRKECVFLTASLGVAIDSPVVSPQRSWRRASRREASACHAGRTGLRSDERLFGDREQTQQEDAGRERGKEREKEGEDCKEPQGIPAKEGACISSQSEAANAVHRGRQERLIARRDADTHVVCASKQRICRSLAPTTTTPDPAFLAVCSLAFHYLSSASLPPCLQS